MILHAQLSVPVQPVIRLLRPHQYLKNGFVLIGALFGHQWDPLTLLQACLVFIAFCCMASAVYVLNDIMDLEADRAHPVKRDRPLPSGQLTLSFARKLMAVLVVVSFLLVLSVGLWATLCVAVYFGLNVLYSWRLKHVVILDVFIIASGFMLRILAGTVGLGITPSDWLLLCGLMITLFLGFTKRRAELLMAKEGGGARSRRVLNDYSPAVLEQFIAVTAACTLLSYSLYTLSPKTVAIHGNDNMIYTLPFVLYGMFRYLFLLHHHAKGNDTAKDLLTDRHLLTTVGAWVLVSIWVLA